MSKLRVAGIGFTAVTALALAACSSNDSASSGSSSSAPAPAPSSSMSAPMSSAASGDGVTTNADVFGPACSQLPQGSAPGSLDSMGPQPVASAASTNPLLTKLVAAVKATNLVDTLNSQQAITVFAPADPAFQALGDAKFNELAGKPDQLAPILQYHVVGKRYDAKGLESAKSVESLNTAGGPVKIEGSGENMTVNGAKVLCGNIPTKNATVFVIDKVLTPGTNKN
ncbi:fasciclin domain-containing protein [Amycolatopsis roodepoortensis]|uniref:fasciclin domain-containing protein n=1 Tax=Amycolatopsis TaxID=1813 RepID=UPI000879325F|nr:MULTISPECIES: fasciclin domain-containing protein [Amycolatopsis]RSN26348.1 fasciclin domain-containing protein [Streptomyces sp. WAC 05977]UUV34078.1 fasciclin domain-containing protein [Amycolatopsis roodepoortensis]SDU39017.1 Uncaracterized surface protein containing fasciclin (FAS1) repeats [Amycolatopsis keratiniphila]